jgi:hypothetical protein
MKKYLLTLTLALSCIVSAIGQIDPFYIEPPQVQVQDAEPLSFFAGFSLNVKPVIATDWNFKLGYSLSEVSSVLSQNGIAIYDEALIIPPSISIGLGNKLSVSYYNNKFYTNFNTTTPNRNTAYPSNKAFFVSISLWEIGYVGNKSSYLLRPMLEYGREEVQLDIYEFNHSGNLSNFLSTFEPALKKVEINGKAHSLRTGLSILVESEIIQFGFTAKYKLTRGNIKFEAPELPSIRLSNFDFTMSFGLKLGGFYKLFKE